MQVNIQVNIKGTKIRYEPKPFDDYTYWKKQSGALFCVDTVGDVPCFIKCFKVEPAGIPLVKNLIGKKIPLLPEIYDYVVQQEQNTAYYYLFTEVLKGAALDKFLLKDYQPDIQKLCSNILRVLDTIHIAGYWMSNLCEKNIFLSGGKYYLIDLDTTKPLDVRPTAIISEPGYVQGQEFACHAIDYYDKVLDLKGLQFEEFDGRTLNLMQTALLCAKLIFYTEQKKLNPDFSYRDKTLHYRLPLILAARIEYASSFFISAKNAQLSSYSVTTLVRLLMQPKGMPTPAAYRTSTKWKSWWDALDTTWQNIFKKATKAEPTAPDFWQKINSLKKLDCFNNQISSLEPLQALRNLTILDCRGNQITSLEPLKELENLTELYCGYNYIPYSEVQALKKTLPSLTVHYIRQKQIGSRTPTEWQSWWNTFDTTWQTLLKKATNAEPAAPDFWQKIEELKEFDCSNNQITSLEPIKEFKNLTTLICWNNQISSLEPVKELKNLTELRCWNNQISSLEPIEVLENLTELRCYRNQINSLEPLKALGNLTTLDCSNNQISSLEPLKALGNLTTLDCSNNQISSLEPLKALGNLTTLDCRDNQITSLEPLKALENLITLYCSYNYILDTELIALQKVINRLKIVSTLQKQIGNYTLTEWQNWWSTMDTKWQTIFKKATNAEPISLDYWQKIEALKGINCSGKQITSLEPLKVLKNLSTLDCRNNEISSLEPLKALKNLTKLDCRENYISDSELQALQKALPGVNIHYGIQKQTVSRTLKEWQNWWRSLDTTWQTLFKKATSAQPTAPDFWQKIEALKNLNCSGKQITSLEPLRVLKNLSTLDCGSNQITSLEPLMVLKNLSTLDCGSNQITSLEPLKYLKNLRELTFSFNIISSLEPINALENLTKIYCTNNQISSLEPLRKLKNLTTFTCGSNYVSSLEPLKNLTNLEEIYCFENQIVSLEPLKGLKNLAEIYCFENQICSLEPLKYLENLIELDCSSNCIPNTELQALQKALPGVNIHYGTQKQTVSLALTEWQSWWDALDTTWQTIFKTATNAQPTTPDFWEKIEELEELNCSANQIISLEPLKELKNLATLRCTNNEIISLEPLKELKNLKRLYCSNNQITSLEPLKNLTNLEEIYCFENQIISLEPLKELENLVEICCFENQIVSLEPLKKLENLAEIYCFENQISSLEPLKKLKNLTILDCSYNYIPGTEVKALQKVLPQLKIEYEPQKEIGGSTITTWHNWWNALDTTWQAVLKKAANAEPTAPDFWQKIKALKKLDCAAKKIKSLEPLKTLENLTILNCSNNEITSLEPLEQLFNLTTLNCSANQIISLEPLKTFKNLTELNCSYNPLSSLEPLKVLENLRTLNCSANQLQSLEPIQELKNLTKFSCYFNRIQSLEPLKTLKKLVYLSCYNNRIFSLEPLKVLENLTELDCRQNYIRYAEVQDLKKALPEVEIIYEPQKQISTPR